MSELKVNKVTPRSGTTVTLGDSGDTITIPSGATIDLSSATQTGVGGANTPAFCARLSTTQTGLANDTFIKIQYNTEIFDTNSNYDNATNYRFTPTVAGKYMVFASINFGTDTDDTRINYIAIYKNGSNYYQIMKDNRDGYTGISGYNNDLLVNGIVEFNGTTDYVEIFGRIWNTSAGTRQFVAFGSSASQFGAYKLIE
jgi:hypothetical protein